MSAIVTPLPFRHVVARGCASHGARQSMAGRVVVIGAGMAGLWTALALAPTGGQIMLLQREPPPPAGGPDALFDDGARRGVGQLRHSHAFLARLRVLIRD